MLEPTLESCFLRHFFLKLPQRRQNKLIWPLMISKNFYTAVLQFMDYPVPPRRLLPHFSLEFTNKHMFSNHITNRLDLYPQEQHLMANLACREKV